MSGPDEARRLAREGIRKNGSSSHLVGIIKFLLVSVNCVVLLLEIGLIAIAVYLTSSDKSLLINGLGQKVYDVSFVSIIIGGIFVILFTVFGIIGAIRENHCFLTIYFTLMFIIVLGEVGAIAFTANKIDSVRVLVKDNVYRSLRFYNHSVTITEAWDLFQKENQCCGMMNPENSTTAPWKAYEQSKYLNDSSVPESCCTSAANMSECMKGTENFIFAKDCFEVLKDLLTKHQTIILAVGLSSLFSTVVALFLTGSFIVLR